MITSLPSEETASRSAVRRRIPAERLAIRPEAVASRVLSLIRRPRRVAYVPSALAVVPWIELAFGWAIDRLGPIALRRQVRPVDARSDQNKLW